MYCSLSETRSTYRPRHAAPSVLLRFARQLTLALVSVHLIVGYYQPPRHRRRPVMVQTRRTRLGAATDAGYGLSPYSAFVTSQVRGDRVALHAGV
jgi:hypothetical protein